MVREGLVLLLQSDQIALATSVFRLDMIHAFMLFQSFQKEFMRKLATEIQVTDLVAGRV